MQIYVGVRTADAPAEVDDRLVQCQVPLVRCVEVDGDQDLVYVPRRGMFDQ